MEMRGGNNMKIVDLSITWGSAITPVPGLPSIEFSPLTTHEEHHRSNTKVVFSIHTGTHIDAPYHFNPKGITIDQVPLETFIGPAIVLDIRKTSAPKKAITIEDLKSAGLPELADLKGKRLILHSGWAKEKWDQPNFYTENPFIHPETAEFLSKSGITALGVDCAVDQGDPFPVHNIMLRAGIPLIENLINLDKLPKTFTLVALPLKVEKGDGGPARAVAFVD
jgi:arylformamidase